MSMAEYDKAYKLGKKDYQTRMMHGQQPTLRVLDEILPRDHHYAEVPLGLVQIPIDRIVGTKTGGRSNAFSGERRSSQINGRNSATAMSRRGYGIPSRLMSI